MHANVPCDWSSDVCSSDLICRNLVVTYFEEALQRQILDRIFKKLYQGGFFVMGIHESLPDGITDVIQYNNIPGIYKKAD
jgi:chemotaxis methyl-accepting protein methylase